VRRRTALLCSLLVASILSLNPASAQDGFRPAKFRGLTMGKDKIADVTRLLGKPETILRKPDATWIYYKDLGPAPGEVEIIADTKTTVIESVNVYPTELTLEKAKAIFGPAFKVIRYEFDGCLSFGGAAPLYESEDGQFEHVVYAGQGIVINNGGKYISWIAYRSIPIGTKQSRCMDKNARPR
jgi:hypothetical protein